MTRHLPPEAATFEEQNGGWTVEAHFLASLIEVVWEGARLGVQPWVKNRSSLPDSITITRPGQQQRQREERRVVSMADFAQYVKGQR